MKNRIFALLSLLVAAPFSHCFAERLIPAGSIVQCTVNEPKISSKTENVGDPILCQVGYSGYGGRFGPAALPYDSFLVGRFEAYKDPGHLVGKGWMELTFDRMVVEPDTVIPLSAKVVGVSGYNVDRQGRILGKGHATRDTIEWMLPILWPIDVLNLPRRGPRPTLKAETRLTLKVMDDIGVPDFGAPQEESPGLLRRAPSAYHPPSLNAAPPPPPGPVYYPLAAVSSAPIYRYAAAPAYTAPAPLATPVHRMPYVSPESTAPRKPITLVFNDGRPSERIFNYMLSPTAVYVLDGDRRTIPVTELDIAATRQVNQEAGVDFRLPGFNRP
jgi:hypothetical protein